MRIDRDWLGQKGTAPADTDIPRIVIGAVMVLMVLLSLGAVYLFFTAPFYGVRVMELGEIPGGVVVLTDYQGSILGIETARAVVYAQLNSLGLIPGQAITVFAKSPSRLRPIDIQCRVGYLLSLGMPLRELPPPVYSLRIHPGKCLMVRVRGQGNFTGLKAYKAAARVLNPQGLQTGEGERYEVKIKIEGHEYIEHWIPVR